MRGRSRPISPQERLADCKGEVDALLAHYGVQGRYIAIETQNWNAVWESSFPPVDVEGRLLIRAPFHEPAPAGVMEVVVMPKMSFGTGTTRPPGSCRVPCSTWRCRRPPRARYGQRYGCAVDRRRQMRCRPCRCGRHRRLGRRQLPRNIASERRRRPHRTDAGRRAPHRRTALRLYPGQYQPQYPHGRHAGLCRSAGAGRRPGDERFPGTGRPGDSRPCRGNWACARWRPLPGRVDDGSRAQRGR